MTKRNSRRIMAGTLPIGGGAPVSIQSMTNTDTRDTESTSAQIRRLAQAGCQLVRVAVPDMDAVRALYKIKKDSPIPVAADIHFNYKLAIESAAAGADKIRINPGNIGSRERVRAVCAACRAKSIPIRIGVNSGSVEKEARARHPGDLPGAMADSAVSHIKLLENEDFCDICVSLKASDVSVTVEAYRRIAEICDYPLHLGVTHTGTPKLGIIKSAAGIGGLLAMGIGDTIRVTLTADPVEEVRTGIDILHALELRREGAEVIACPTCGRCMVDLIPLADEVEKALADIKKPIKVAVMGCAVNGPGEGREADIGVACGKGDGLLFRSGEILYKVPYERIVPAIRELAENYVKDN